MPQFLAPIINEQTFDANGDPLVGGTISVYLAGSSTPASTTSDQAGVVPNTWPITLNTLGVNSQGAVWLTGGFSYKFVIKDASAATLRTIDNVSGINDSAATVDQWVVYAGTPTYVSANSFTVPGDQTQVFPFGTRLRTVNTSGIVYATVVRSAFSGNATTVTVITDSGVLDSGLSSVSVGIITASNPSLPGTLTVMPYRNRLMNGALRIDQRNGGAPVTIVSAASPVYTVDCFYASCTGANVTVQLVAGTGYKNAVTIAGAASNTSTMFGQRIESFNCNDWANKQVNVQIPISAVGITSVTWNAYTADATDNFSAKTLIATGSIPVSAAIETKFFSFQAGGSAGRGVAIELVTGALLAGQTVTLQGAFQAEAGQVSPFETIEIGEDSRRCQRYFEIGKTQIGGAYPTGGAGASTIAEIVFKATKRTTPTMAQLPSSTSSNVSANSFASPRTGSCGHIVTIGAAVGNYSLLLDWAASADL